MASNYVPQTCLWPDGITMGLNKADKLEVTYAPKLVNKDGKGQVIILPTVDPKVNGALWNQAGVIRISAG